MTNGNSKPPATTSAPPMMAAGAVTAVNTGTLIMDTYEIEKLINSGGMGEVYRGRNIHNGEPVAIKIVLPSLAHDPKIVALFQKESTVLSRLSHEAIVRYHTFTIDRSIGRPCMVMEFVSGTPLGERVEQGPMPLDEVKVMFRRVASGLDKAHRAGVVHRDLSPDNVILEEGSVDHAKLIDFGIAKSASFGGGTLLGGQFAGKFNWVAPEQLGAFGGLVDGRSDIYSLALLVAAASRGKVVAMGDSIVDAVGKRMGVPDLTGVDPELLPLLSYMLQPDPANRPDSMAAVIAALDKPALVPAFATLSAPQAQDTNRTVIGGALPIAPQTQTPVSVAPSAPSPMPSAVSSASSPPASDWAMSQPGPTTSSPATIIAPQILISQPPLPLNNPVESEDVSPFGAPTGPAMTPAAIASSTSAAPVKKGGSGMLAVVGLLVVVGGAAGAYFGGFIGAPVEMTADQRIAQDEVEAKAAEEAAKKAEQTAAEAEGKLAAEKLAAVQADAEVAKQAEATQAEADRIAQEAKAAEVAAAEKAAAQKTAEDAAAKKAADDAAAKIAEETAAKAAADQAAAEAKAQAEATARAAEAEAAAVKAAEAEAATAAKADPLIAQLEWLKATPMPTCVHLRPATDADALTLDGYATSTGPLEELSRSLSAKLKREADIAPRLINDAQCPVIGFVNARQSSEVPALTVRREGPETAVKSGGKISLVVEGLNGRPYSIFLFSDAGGATNLKPFVAESSDGSATFTFTLSMAAGAPPAPQVVLVMATDTKLAKLDLVPNGVTAKSLMPFIEVALKDNKGSTALGLGFFRLEN